MLIVTPLASSLQAKQTTVPEEATKARTIRLQQIALIMQGPTQCKSTCGIVTDLKSSLSQSITLPHFRWKMVGSHQAQIRMSPTGASRNAQRESDQVLQQSLNCDKQVVLHWRRHPLCAHTSAETLAQAVRSKLWQVSFRQSLHGERTVGIYSRPHAEPGSGNTAKMRSSCRLDRSQLRYCRHIPAASPSHINLPSRLILSALRFNMIR